MTRTGGLEQGTVGTGSRRKGELEEGIFVNKKKITVSAGSLKGIPEDGDTYGAQGGRGYQWPWREGGRTEPGQVDEACHQYSH